MRHARRTLIALAFVFGARATVAEVRTDAPRVAPDAIVAVERDGFVVVEAEDFFHQRNTVKRAWHITDSERQPSVGRDIDTPNHTTAGGGACIEVLPDEGNDGTPPVRGLSISDTPGEMAVVSYRVRFTTPGRYFIWSRAFGTDGDDNTLHYGINETWPESSARAHTFGGKQWRWACRHRQHKGKIHFDVTEPGVHIVELSMREDGCELDQFVLTTAESWTPPEDEGIVSSVLATESGGMLVFEAEALAPAEGWEVRRDDSRHTGEGYLVWTLPGQGRRPGEGVLVLPFRITTAGTYQFLWRSRLPDPSNRPETRDPDGNDTWVRFSGGTDVPGYRPSGEKWNKVALLDHPSGWSWSTHADQGPPHPDSPVVRHLPAGVHRLELSGRSSGHMIDRLVLRRFEGRAVFDPAEGDEVEIGRR